MASLYDQGLAYLSQRLPDISGIFPETPAVTPTPVVEETASSDISGLTPEQLALLFSQNQRYFNQDGGGDDDVPTNTNNAGLTGIEGLLTALGFMVNPIGTIAYQGIKKGYDNFINTGNPFDMNRNNINRAITEGSTYGTDLGIANLAQARGITKSLASRPSATSGTYQQGPGGEGGGGGPGPGETSSGSFGSSTNDAGFSDYS